MWRPPRPRSGSRPRGRVDGFICAVGSGGTLAGVAEGLRARKPEVKIGLADPDGAALYNWYAHGELKAEGSSITEGIGQGRVTANLEGLDGRPALQHPRRRGAAGLLRPDRGGGALHGRLDRHQRGRRDAHGARPRAGQDHRHHPLRLRHPLSVAAVQPGVPARRRACRSRPGSRAGGPTSSMCGRAERRRRRPGRCGPASRAPAARSCSRLALSRRWRAGAGPGRRRHPPLRDLGGRRPRTPRRGSPTRRPRPPRSRRCASGWSACAPRRRRLEREAAPNVGELNNRLEALGPPPGRGRRGGARDRRAAQGARRAARRRAGPGAGGAGGLPAGRTR